MSRLTFEHNYQVICEVDINQFHSTIERRRESQKSYAEGLAADIRRHCEGFTDIRIEAELCEVCQYCDATWTELDRGYNGGCCDEDQKSAPVCQERERE